MPSLSDDQRQRRVLRARLEELGGRVPLSERRALVYEVHVGHSEPRLGSSSRLHGPPCVEIRVAHDDDAVAERDSSTSLELSVLKSVHPRVLRHCVITSFAHKSARKRD